MEKSNAFDENTEKLHFLDYWQVISKRKEVIIATSLIIIFVATMLSLILPSKYTGQATIKVESSVKELNPLQITGTGRPDVLDPQDFMTHYAQMTSPRVLEMVVKGAVKRTIWKCPTHKNIRLDSPTLDGKCPEPGCGNDLIRSQEDKYPKWEPLNVKWAKRDKLDRPYNIQQTQLMLLNSLKIEPRRGTKLIDVYYTSRDRYEASEIANMLCEVYLQYFDEENKRTLGLAMDGLRMQLWEQLRGRMDDKGKKIEPGLLDLQDELAAIKVKYKLLIDTRDPRNPTRMDFFDFAPLLQQKTTLKVQIEAEQITLNAWKSLKGDERASAFSSKFQSVLAIKQAIISQKAELSKAKQNYGPEHPIVKQINELIMEFEKNLDDEIDGIIQNQERLVLALKKQVEEVDRIIQEARKEYYDKEQGFTEYKLKLDEVDRKNFIYNQISQTNTLQTIKTAMPSVTLQLNEMAQIPIYPSAPNRLQNIIIGIIAGLTLGTGLAYFIEYLDTSIKTIDDIERTLGLQILGVIPQKVRILTEESQNSPAYEAYRILWTNIEFARQDSRIQSVVVTSGGVAEGKTTTVVNLAIAIANSGLNVLLVDSDFRRPRIHRLLDLSNQIGLTDILMRNADPDGVVIRSSVPNLWVVPSGKLPPNAVGLLTSKRLKECVDHFSNKYDIVLYDSPPVLGLSDTAVLASIVDRVLLCVEYRKYPRSLSIRARKTLENVGGKLLGAIVNNINVLKEDPTYYSQVYHYFQATPEEQVVTTSPDEPKRKTDSGGKAKKYYEDDDVWK